MNISERLNEKDYSKYYLNEKEWNWLSEFHIKENVFISKLFPWICHPIYLPESNKMREGKKKENNFPPKFYSFEFYFLFFLLLFYEGKQCGGLGCLIFGYLKKNCIHKYKFSFHFRIGIQFHYKYLVSFIVLNIPQLCHIHCNMKIIYGNPCQQIFTNFISNIEFVIYSIYSTLFD